MRGRFASNHGALNHLGIACLPSFTAAEALADCWLVQVRRYTATTTARLGRCTRPITIYRRSCGC